MKNPFVVLVEMIVGAIVAFLIYRSLMPHTKTPDEVVAAAIESLSDADFKKLRNCYSDRAWEILSGSLPSERDYAARNRLRKYMEGFQEVRIQSTLAIGDTATVHAVIQYEEANEREIFHLVHTKRGWRID